MVRREAAAAGPPSGGSSGAACCGRPAGASPVPVSAGAPGSRPQTRGEILVVRAGRREPLRREQERGPQHEVNPAASSDLQSGSRAAHLTAKATSRAHAPERAWDPGGVRGAARVQGWARNTRDPSAPPSSRQGASYKPMAKTNAAQRESEGLVVPSMIAKNNAIGGKGPCFGHARSEGKREGMAGETGPNNPTTHLRCVQVRQPQRGLGARAKSSASSVGAAKQTEPGDAGAVAVISPPTRSPHASQRRPSVSRVREIRTHGLKGGPALSPVTTVNL